MNDSGSQIELIGRLENTLKELYYLLERYAPVWYPKELHDKAEAALQMLEEVSGRSSESRTGTNGGRGISLIYSNSDRG